MNAQRAEANRPLTRDDRIYRETRWLAGVIIPFLVVAFGILFLWPTETGRLFAWPINSPMTAMMLASAYMGGVYYFTGVLTARRWHHVKTGFLPVIAFASILCVATILHWDRFTHGHISFVAWGALYFTTPALVLAAWLRNRGTDPVTPDPGDVTIPLGWRWFMGAVGVITVVVSALLFVQPALMIAAWAWPLTPLTARVLGAMFALPGLVGLGIALDARWSNARLILQAQACSILFILISVARSWQEFDQANPVTYLFVGGLVLIGGGIIAVSLLMEARTPRGQR